MRPIVWSATLLAGLACAQPAATPDYGADAAAIVDATAQWAAAFQAGDVARGAAFLTAGGTLVPPNAPPVTGTAAIEEWTRSMLAMMTVNNATSITDSVLVAGDWAVSRGRWILTITAGDATVTDTSRYVVIWERQADGAWKAAHDLWNLASPLPAPEGGAGGGS